MTEFPKEESSISRSHECNAGRSVHRQTRDLFLAQRFVRHASPLTTTVYTHRSDDEMSDRLLCLEC